MKLAHSPVMLESPAALERFAAGRGSGALYLDGDPGGVCYLIEDRVAYVDSPAAPGVDRLLTASVRLDAASWERTVRAGGRGGRAGRLLTEQGLLARGELELCVLTVIFDGAYFAFGSGPSRAWFVPGATHPLGPVCRVDPGTVGREVERRRTLLDRAWPYPDLDRAPLTAVPGHRPLARCGPLQREILARADGTRTAAELAWLLGRSGFAVLLEVRRLAAAGVVEPAGTAPAVPTRTPRTRPATSAGPTVPRQLRPGSPPRRDSPDLALLSRIRAALESL